MSTQALGRRELIPGVPDPVTYGVALLAIFLLAAAMNPELVEEIEEEVEGIRRRIRELLGGNPTPADMEEVERLRKAKEDLLKGSPRK